MDKATNTNATSTRLLYIMGRGHSGSTVLDALLGNAESIESVGELVSGLEREGEVCSCGTPFHKCEFWLQVRKSFEQQSNLRLEEGAYLLKRQAHVARWFKTFLARSNSSEVQALTEVNQTIVEAVLQVARKKCMVDSSKEHTRALFLLRFLHNAKIIHLVRNPEGILSSDLFRMRSGSGYKFLRRKFYSQPLTFFFMMLSCTNWVAGNFIAEIIRFLAPERVLRLRYEDLCAAPRGTLERLQSFIGHDLCSVIEAVELGKRMNMGHNIGGNMMRKSGNFVFDPNAGKQRPLPWGYKLMTRLITWPFLLMYGYKVIGHT